MPGLTAKQAAFVREYLVDLNGKQAAIRAGYAPKRAEGSAYELLRKHQVRAAVDEALKARAERVEVKADDVLRELLRIARVDIGQAFDEKGRLRPLHEMPEDVRRGISGLETEELWDGAGRDRVSIGQVRKVKFWDKVKALELLGKHLAIFTERVEHEVVFEGLTDAQLEARLLAITSKVAATESKPGGDEC
jgi:phage terminase small subunit